MKNKISIYMLVILLGVMMIWLIIPIGDYSMGIGHGLGFAFFALLLFLVYLILTISHFVRFLKKREKFDFIPTLFILFFAIITALIFNSGKFWTEPVIILDIDNADRYGGLTLYKNDTFEATVSHADFSHTYQGRYRFTNDTIYLLRKDLEQATDSLFTTTYIRSNETIYTASDKNFSQLILSESCAN